MRKLWTFEQDVKAVFLFLIPKQTTPCYANTLKSGQLSYREGKFVRTFVNAIAHVLNKKTLKRAIFFPKNNQIYAAYKSHCAWALN